MKANASLGRTGMIVAAAAIISACGSGSNVTGIEPNAKQVASNYATSANQPASEADKREREKKGELKIALRIPREKRKHHKFRPGYISAATQSMTVSVAGQATQVFNLTTRSPGCSTSTGYITCDVSAFFPSGQQTITVALYDQTNGRGNVLSKATTSANIVAGSTTYISITLEGVVASARVLIDGGTTANIPAGVATSLPVMVSAYDADGQLIVAPGGYDSSTPVTLTNSDTSGITSLTPTSVGGPGTNATFSYNGGALSSAVLTVEVSGTAQANPVTVTVMASPSPTPSPVPTPTPTARPTPVPQTSPSSLSFSSGATQTFTVQETNYTGTLTATSADTTVATVSPASANGPTATFTVQPISGGTTTISVADGLGHAVTVNVSVNGGVIVIDQVPAANPSSLNFDTAASQTFSVHEKEYYGAFTESDTCGGIASATPGSASGPTATFTVSPVNGGTCTATIADAQGNMTGVGISVSAGTITVNGKHGKRPMRGGK